MSAPCSGSAAKKRLLRPNTTRLPPMSPFDRGLVGMASFLVAALAAVGAATVGFTGWSLVVAGAGVDYLEVPQ